MKMVQRWIRSGSLLLVVAAITACGGAQTPSAMSEITAQVVLPTGVTLSAATLTLETALGGGGPLGANGTGVIGVPSDSPTLAVVSNGEALVLMAFVSKSQTVVNARTTAEVLIFFHLNAAVLEPDLRAAMIQWLAADARVEPVRLAVEVALRRDSSVRATQDDISAALKAADAAFNANAAGIRPQGISPTFPDFQVSGIKVLERDPFKNTGIVVNSFRRKVHVYVERAGDPAVTVQEFDLGAATANVIDANGTRKIQQLPGFAQGDVPRSSTSSDEITFEAVNDEPTNYKVTIVGAGGGAIEAGADAGKQQRAQSLALECALDDFIAPAVTAALKPTLGAPPHGDLSPLLARLPAQARADIVGGDFSKGVNAAFADLFTQANLPNTLDQILAVYQPNTTLTVKGKKLLTKALSALYDLSAFDIAAVPLKAISLSKRLETIIVKAVPSKVRVLPPDSTIGKGGSVDLTAQLILGPSAPTDGVTYQWSLQGSAANGGFAAGSVLVGGKTVVAGASVTTTTATGTYQHRDTLGVLYGTDTVTVQALRQGEAIASGTATVTVKPSKITITPTSATLGYSDQSTFNAKVEDAPSGASLSYIFTTFGLGAGEQGSFVGGSSTQVGALSSVTFNATGDTEGAQQRVNVIVRSTLNGQSATLGEASATITISSNPWVGTWVGSITSSCGYYAGALTLKISSVATNSLNLSYTGAGGLSGGYSLTTSGNTARSPGGVVVYTLNGTSLSVFEADSCQRGSFTKVRR